MEECNAALRDTDDPEASGRRLDGLVKLHLELRQYDQAAESYQRLCA